MDRVIYSPNPPAIKNKCKSQKKTASSFCNAHDCSVDGFLFAVGVAVEIRTFAPEIFFVFKFIQFSRALKF